MKTILGQTLNDQRPLDQAQIGKTRQPIDGALFDATTLEVRSRNAGRPVRWNADGDNGAPPIPNAGLPDNQRPLLNVDGYRPRYFRVVR